MKNKKSVQAMIVVLTVALIAVIFSGCQNGEFYNATTKAEQTNQVPEPSGESAEKEKSADYTAILNEYLNKYGTQTYFRDAYLSMKYVLLADNELIVLLALPDVPQVTSIPYASISKYETSTAGNISIFTVTDRSGGKMTINLSSDDASILSKELSKHIN